MPSRGRTSSQVRPSTASSVACMAAWRTVRDTSASAPDAGKEGLKQDHVDDAEDGGGDANGERKSQNDGRAEERGSPEDLSAYRVSRARSSITLTWTDSAARSLLSRTNLFDLGVAVVGKPLESRRSSAHARHARPGRISRLRPTGA
jgi:hypothetical protein